MSPPAGTDDDRTELFGDASGPSIPDRPRFGGVSERERRRRVVELVDSRRNPWTVGELARELTDWFADQSDGPGPTEEEVHDVLFSFDLPALHDRDRLWFDVDSGIVSARRPPQAGGGDGPAPPTPPADRGDADVDDSTSLSWTPPPGSAPVVAVGGLVALAALAGVGPLTPSHALLAAGSVAAYVVAASLFRNP